MHEYAFERLNVWQKTRELVKMVYLFTETFPRYEIYGLVNQVRRAIVSVSSNIAEGSCRQTKKDQAHFYNTAYGSLLEVLSQIILSLDLGYLKREAYEQMRGEIEQISNQLNSLRKAMQEDV
jgi:four helix bundle protein